MISNAFKGAYTNEVNQQTQGLSNITTGVKDAATLVVGSLGFGGAFGQSAVAKGAEHALAGRIGGIGGNLMLATLDQKKATAEAAQQVSKAVEVDQSQQVEASKTVFETLMNKKGMVETSFGEIDPNSPLGQKIKEAVEKDEKKFYDSKKNELSVEQNEFFKDSKVRDKNGNLKIMYHGTDKGDFSVFKTDLEGAYFTENEDYAKVYSRDNIGNNQNKIYPSYLNLKNIFDTRNKKEKDLFYNHFYRKMGTGTDLTSKGLPDWTDGTDLVDFVKEHGYDSFIVDEGGVPLPNGEVKDRGISYVALYPNQIKNITNKKPTENEDINK